jgi:exonuclease VII large subunit
MTPEDQSELLAAMYAADDEDETPSTSANPLAPPRPTGIMSMPAMSAMLRQQAQTIEAQARQIRSLDRRIRAMERMGAKTTQAMRDLDTALDRKIDRRGD